VIKAFAVGIPARDEADRIVKAVQALARAAQRSPAPVHVVVAADRCDDATEPLARAALREGGASWRTASVVAIDSGTAGAARHAACLAALRRAMADGTEAHRVWVATTDGDSAVPPDWFVQHEAWACRGAHGVAGLVDLFADDGLSAAAQRRWRRSIERAGIGHGHPHVHGANLGMRADLWLAAGGFDQRAVGEDHELWRRARALGASLVGCADMVVRTSARTQGRTPAGFAGLLADLDARVSRNERAAPRVAGRGRSLSISPDGARP